MSSTLSFRLPRTVGSRRTVLLLVSVIAAVILLLYKSGLICLTAIYGGHNNEAPAFMLTQKKFIVGADKKIYEYNRNMPLIFIGGVPRSGTTLMRAMLDAHPDVRCGQETRVIPRLLMISRHWVAYEKESVRLEQAGISRDVLDEAVASFCLEIIARHGEPAPRLCNKDPFTLNVGTYLLELFPQSKFIFMVRDGRATVHSIISRKVTITGFDLSDYRQCMVTWNRAAQRMYAQCEVLGAHRCMRVPYEQLVLHPRAWMTRILRFLDVAWNESVLHHEEFVNKPNGILLSKVERSSDQVIKPVNLEALSKWVGQFPESVVHDMAKLAPMLQVLGYDPNANPPNYGSPDSQVVDNTRQVNAESDKWKQRANQLLRKDATASDYHDQLDKMFLGDVTDTPEVA